MDYLYYLFVILAFIAAVLFLEGSYLAWTAYKGPEAKRITQRLRAMSAGVHGNGELSIVKKRLLSETPALERLLLDIPRIHQLDRLLVQSGLRMNVAALLGLTALGFFLGLALGLVIGWPLFLALGLSIAVGLLPFFYVLNAKRKRVLKLEQQLPDTLDLMGRAMRAGHAFPSALKMVGDEMPEPIASEFRTTFDEVNYGINLSTAMQNLAIRVPSTDMRYFVISVLIQRETGGNLAELLDNISALIRARLKLLGTIRVLSAEGRLSAWILCLLPFVLVAALTVINRKFMSILWTDELGLKLIGLMVVLMVIGVLWTRSLIKIRV